jgi:hypothetical protein
VAAAACEPHATPARANNAAVLRTVLPIGFVIVFSRALEASERKTYWRGGVLSIVA